MAFAVLTQNVVGIGDGENSRSLVHVAADSSKAVRCTIEMAVRLRDDGQHFRIDTGRLQHVDANVSVQVQQLGFFRTELVAFE